MKLGVMQPYLFPYIGYFQLIRAVDTFVIYDDVAFIRQGWINRNRIKLNDEARYFSVPLADVSSFRSIRDTLVAEIPYAAFRKKFFTTMDSSYRKAPFYQETRNLLERVFVSECATIADLSRSSIEAVCLYLGLTTRLVPTSSAYNNAHLRKAGRLIDICRREGADSYINAIGGTALYTKEEFAAAGISLQFLRTILAPYPQLGQGAFVPNLSILDVLLNRSPETVRGMLAEYELV